LCACKEQEYLFIMTTHHRTGTAERIGHWLGRMCAAFARRERQAAALIARGMPKIAAKALLLTARLALLAALLYVAFWIVLLVGIFFITFFVMPRYVSEQEDEHLFMTDEELRNSMFYDPVLFNDVAHSNYVDEPPRLF
jgi:fatty acid desaturase